MYSCQTGVDNGHLIAPGPPPPLFRPEQFGPQTAAPVTARYFN